MEHTRLSRKLFSTAALLSFFILISFSLFSCSGKRQPQVPLESEPPSPGQPRLVVLYLTCTLNKNYISPYNPSVSYTPNLGQFAAESAVFARHQTETGQSGIAFASIFTGVQADLHGIFEHPKKMNSSVYQVTQAFADNGYDVIFWGAHPMASDALGYGRGNRINTTDILNADDPLFQKVIDKLSGDPNYKALLITTFTVTHAKYLPENKPGLQFKDVYRMVRGTYRKHLPDFWTITELPDELAATGLTAEQVGKYRKLYRSTVENDIAYDFENTMRKNGLEQDEWSPFASYVEYLYKLNVARLDRMFGRTLDAIEEAGLYDDSLVLFTADHGEKMYREGTFFHFSHGYEMAPEVISVPLMVRGPALGIKPEKYEVTTRSTDIFPTVANLCGLEIPDNISLDGTSMAGAITGREESPDLPAFSHTTLVHAIVEDDVKDYKVFMTLYPGRDPAYIWVGMRENDLMFKLAKFDLDKPVFQPALFDLSTDPLEQRNIFDYDNEEHNRVLEELAGYKARLSKAHANWEAITEGDISDEEKTRRLKDMGYIK